MKEKNFTRKSFAKKPYRVDAKVLESKGFEMIRYDRHESYAKTYRIEGRAFIGAVNPVTGDRTISKAGPFASVKDMECLRAAWDQLSEDVLGPRPTASNPQDAWGTASNPQDAWGNYASSTGEAFAILGRGRPLQSRALDRAVIEDYTTTPAVLTEPAPGNGSLAVNDGKLHLIKEDLSKK